ncbi:hypothetical protein GTW37_23335 [Streptomyces sp. SID4931]|nr:hypothetical protein [Streptomyces sp. SID4931]SCF99388.1 hypothetical protein GA0115255_114947 [Streptomyces sp. Ncost-T6T-2b]
MTDRTAAILVKPAMSTTVSRRMGASGTAAALWEPELAEAMAEHGITVAEELVADPRFFRSA